MFKSSHKFVAFSRGKQALTLARFCFHPAGHVVDLCQQFQGHLWFTHENERLEPENAIGNWKWKRTNPFPGGVLISTNHASGWVYTLAKISGTQWFGWAVNCADEVAVAQKAPLEQRHAVCATISTAVALFSGFFNILPLGLDDFWMIFIQKWRVVTVFMIIWSKYNICKWPTSLNPPSLDDISFERCDCPFSYKFATRYVRALLIIFPKLFYYETVAIHFAINSAGTIFVPKPN